MRSSRAFRATLVAIAANLFLLALKATATSLSDSLTIFSETLNSLSDVISTVVILLCVKWAAKHADLDHPFGHHRAEPIAGLLVAIFTGILGFEVWRTAVMDFWAGNLSRHIGPLPMAALAVTAAIKTVMAIYYTREGRRRNSPALRAIGVDARNDVVISLQGLLAVVVADFRLPVFDLVAAAVVGSYIFYSAHRIGMENLDYLMGKAPDRELLDTVRAAAAGVPRVQHVSQILGHYVGPFVHLELTAQVDGRLTTAESHDVAEAVCSAVEEIASVDRAFVHIEPVPQR